MLVGTIRSARRDRVDISGKMNRFIKNLPCRVQRPYPSVKGVKPNIHYAEKLLDAYANGEKSELTAITQYVNHHMMIPYKGIADLELCISLIEMKHLDLIGDLIRRLGLDPKYYRTNRSYWSGANVAYGSSTREMLEFDIEGEKAAIHGYHVLYAEIDDPIIRHLIARIVEDEQLHLRLFERALKSLK